MHLDTADDLASVIEALRHLPRKTTPSGRDDLLPFVYETEVRPATGHVPGTDVRPELLRFWQLCGGVEINRDLNYGQWGFIIYGPDKVPAATKEWARIFRHAFAPGELIIGRCRGDTDQILMMPDGGIVIIEAMDKPANWPRVAESLGEFLLRCAASPDAKYWEPGGNQQAA